MNSQNIVDVYTVVGLVSSCISVLLAFYAIWQAYSFYTKAKDSETRTEVALAEIKAQTETLQKLTGTQIKNLTKAITSQSPTEKALLDALSQLSGKGANIRENINVPKDSDNAEMLRAELVSSYLCLHHYAALANNSFTFTLRTCALDDQFKTAVLSYIDYTYKDFMHMERVIGLLNKQEIEINAFINLYRTTENEWKPHVRSVDQLKASGEA